MLVVRTWLAVDRSVASDCTFSALSVIGFHDLYFVLHGNCATPRVFVKSIGIGCYMCQTLLCIGVLMLPIISSRPSVVMCGLFLCEIMLQRKRRAGKYTPCFAS